MVDLPAETILRRIEKFPRFPLATFPTPLEEAPHLSRELKVRLFFKREDLPHGLALGGNKVRKLEFLIADALTVGADVIVTSGPIQSNHVRLTAAAACKAGLEATVVLWGEKPSEVQGNLLLDHLLGAKLMYTSSPERGEVDTIAEEVCADLRRQGRRPYLIEPGGAMPLGRLSYAACVYEILDQLSRMNIQADYLICPAGACGTYAGLLLGVKLFNAHISVCGISVSHPSNVCKERIACLIEKSAHLLEVSIALADEDITIYDRYVEPGYGINTSQVQEVIRLAARSEGLLLDPVYTGKTMVGLRDLVRRGQVKQGATVILLHTGGVPALFAHAHEFNGPRGGANVNYCLAI